MWKKQDAEGAQPESPSKQRPDVASLRDARAESLMNEDLQKVDFAVVSQQVLTADSNQPLPSPTMKTYTEAVKEFTKNATAFIEQLPLLTKAQGAYEEAMRASTEMRKVLDASDENLRTLMTQLEKRINLQEFKSAADKKPPEPARVERMTGTDESGSRGSRWP
jgi:hypothetical protein